MAKYSQVDFVKLEEPQNPGKPKRSRPFRLRGNGIHWKIPSIMVASLIGIIFAVGHHAFYSYYNGRVADNEREQRLVINAGTAFAFLVQMFLATATGNAYVQNFWLSMKSRPHSISHIDTMYSALQNLLAFWDLRIWGGHPVLLLLALVTWLVSLLPRHRDIRLTRQIGAFQ